ncbi:hypothetical protein GG344DRAFT_81024 [Lentinula edodes]|nr:hypothetical protein GG344DRAFT_81024 [Lentinula edodes]
MSAITADNSDVCELLRWGREKKTQEFPKSISSRICAGTIEFAVVTGVIAVVNPLSSETGKLEKAR